MATEDRLVASFRVGAAQAGLRLDHYLKERIPKLSRERIQDAIRSRVELPGRLARAKPALLMREGDLVLVREVVVAEPDFPRDLEPRLLHLDDDLLAVDKPAGLPVHSTRKIVKNQLIRWVRDRYGENLALAHRIDRETSGIVLCTRHRAAARVLGFAFASGNVHKEYLAVVLGVPPEQFRVDLSIGKDPASAVHIKQGAGVPGGAASATRFARVAIAASGERALVRAFPETGRRHQIRVHLAAAGFPVVGDKLYAAGERHFLNFAAHGPSSQLVSALGAARHLLHAAVLQIRHPATGQTLRIESEPPPDFAEALGG